MTKRQSILVHYPGDFDRDLEHQIIEIVGKSNLESSGAAFREGRNMRFLVDENKIERLQKEIAKEIAQPVQLSLLTY